MALPTLPHELINIIANELDNKDLSVLIRSNSSLYHTLNHYLYSRNANKPSGESALIWAAKHDSEGTLQRFVDAGAQVRWKSEYWESTFPWTRPGAQHFRHIRASRFREHPISHAAEHGHIKFVLRLLDLGADINFENLSGRTPLSLAAGAGHLELVRALVTRGANLLSIDCDGQSPTARAASQGCYDIEDYLIEHLRRQSPPLSKENLKTEMYYMLWYAAERGDEDRIQYLLAKRSADVDINSCLLMEGNTPLCAAIAHAPLSMIRILLSHGADPNVSFSKSRGPPPRLVKRTTDLMAPLQLALPRNDSYEIVQLLVNHGLRMDIDMVIWDKIFRLHKLDEFRLLVAAGADIDSDPKWLNALYTRAIEHNCRRIFDFFDQRGAEGEIIPEAPPRTGPIETMFGTKRARRAG